MFQSSSLGVERGLVGLSIPYITVLKGTVITSVWRLPSFHTFQVFIFVSPS